MVFDGPGEAQSAVFSSGFIFALVGGAGPGASGGVAGARVFDFSVQ